MAQVLKYGALSANLVSEEPIDEVLFQSYPQRDSIRWGACEAWRLRAPWGGRVCVCVWKGGIVWELDTSF